MAAKAKNPRSPAWNALGALRDAVGTVGNLDQLLRSPKVAPKALGAILPDVASTLPALEAELAGAMRLMAERFDPRATADLFAFLALEVSGLHQAIVNASQPGRPLNASARLSLERNVSRAQQQLIGALPLFEVMTEVAHGSLVSLDLHELLVLLRRGDQSHGLQGRTLSAGLAEGSVPLTLMGSPRATLTLIALAAALANEHTSPPALTIGLHRDGAVARMSLSARPSEPRFSLVLPPVVTPTEASVRAITRTMNIAFERDADGATLTWTELSPR